MKRYPRMFHGQNSPDTLWVEFQFMEIQYQSAQLNRTSGGIQTKSVGETVQFLLQKDFSYTQNHEWTAFDTVEGKIVDTVAKAQTAGTSVVSPRGIGHRADFPVVFTNSPRREYSFEIELGSQGDNRLDVWEPVNLLQEYSSAQNQGLTQFQYPYAVKCKTKTGQGAEVPIVNLKYGAITSVQPSFSAPYVKGYPTTCKLTVTVMDLLPLFRSSYSEGMGKVTAE